MVCSRVVRKSGPRPQARDASTEAEGSRLSARLSFQDLEVLQFYREHRGFRRSGYL